MNIRKHDALFRFNEAQELEIIDAYLLRHLSIAKIARQYQVDRDTISRLLKRHNIEKYKLGSHLRKYPLNEHYFDVIDTEDKAYFLGLLYADGCNHFDEIKPKISISLQENDKDILVKFSKYLYGNEFLQFVKGRSNNKNQYCLTINSSLVSQKLHDLGIVARKSLVLTWPEWLIDPELQRHFIRGYFDGDGSISKSKRNNTYDYHWSLISTKMFCSDVANIIKSNLDVHICNKQSSKGNKITQVIYIRGCDQILRVLNWLYQDAAIYLERKHSKYLELRDERMPL